jgi:lactam utilization protein B
MSSTVKACKAAGIKCGAHPGLPDIQGFGRREISLELDEFTAITTYQVGALKGFLDAEGVELHHVKPHGKLYGMMCRDYEIACAVLRGVPKGVPVFGLAGTQMERAARDLGVEFWAELYGDVKYNGDGSLVIDKKKKAWREEEVRKHIGGQLNEGAVTAVDGSRVELKLGEYPVSVCCHSDSPGCMEIIRVVKEEIDNFNKAHGHA